MIPQISLQSNGVDVLIVRDPELRTTLYEPRFWETTFQISDATKADYTAKIARHIGVPASLIHNLTVCQDPEWMGGYTYVVFWLPTLHIREREISGNAIDFRPGKALWCSGYPMQRVQFELSHVMQMGL